MTDKINRYRRHAKKSLDYLSRLCIISTLKRTKRLFTDSRMQKSTDPALYWIGLSSIPGVGRATFRKLVKHFGSPERALKADRDELRKLKGCPKR
jgi:ERCC4-type nuclease